MSYQTAPLAVVVLALAATVAHSETTAPGPLLESFSGSAFSTSDNALLYRETDFLSAGPDGSERVVLYRCADGQPFARKIERDHGNAQAPDFELADARFGYREGVRRREGEREVYVQRSAAQPEQAAPLQLPADGVIDFGFDAFARAHWRELVDGVALKMNFLVPSRRTFFAFKIARIDNPDGLPPNSITFRLSSTSWVSFLLPHIDVSYDLAARRPLRYEGLSNVRDPTTGKNYRVRFEYPKIAAGVVDPAELADALAAPLVSACTPADSTASASGHAAVPEVTAATPRRNQTP